MKNALGAVVKSAEHLSLLQVKGVLKDPQRTRLLFDPRGGQLPASEVRGKGV